MSKDALKLPLFFVLTCLCPPCVSAQDPLPDSHFSTTWNQLSTTEKHQFIAGYLKGQGDISQVLEIAEGFLRENPSKALESITQLKKIYRRTPPSPIEATEAIDRFYRKDNNRDKPLSLAVSAARAQLPIAAPP